MNQNLNSIQTINHTPSINCTNKSMKQFIKTKKRNQKNVSLYHQKSLQQFNQVIIIIIMGVHIVYSKFEITTEPKSFFYLIYLMTQTMIWCMKLILI